MKFVRKKCILSTILLFFCSQFCLVLGENGGEIDLSFIMMMVESIIWLVKCFGKIFWKLEATKGKSCLENNFSEVFDDGFYSFKYLS